MEIIFSPGGEYTHNVPQQKWQGESEDFQTALFGGQKMTAICASDGGNEYQLWFMGLKVGGFSSLSEAKKTAPEFARAVFDKLKASILDD